MPFSGESRRLKKMKMFYCVIFSLSLMITLGTILYNKGTTISIFFFNNYDHFMDFFYSIKHSQNENLYNSFEAIYPPLAYLIYGLFARFIPTSILKTENALILRNNRQAMLCFLFMTLAALVFLTSLVKNYLDDKNPKSWFQWFFSNTIFISAPFLFLIERGNMLLITIVFTMGFVCLKDSENKLVREIALLALALAAATKIYPAIFGLLLLQEKRYKDALRCVIYGIVAFTLPFLFFGGLPSIKLFIESLWHTTKRFDFDLEIGFHLDLRSFFAALTFIFGGKISSALALAQVSSYFFSFILIICSFFYKEPWKKALAFSVLVIIFPSFNYYYTAVFYLAPLVMFFKQKEHKRMDWLYLVPLTIIVLPLALGGYSTLFFINGGYPLTVDVLICNCVQFFLVLLLSAEGIGLIKKRALKKPRPRNGSQRKTIYKKYNYF